MKRIKVVFVLSNLSRGGAERVMSHVAENLNPKIFDVKLLITGASTEQDYEVFKVQTVFLNKARVFHAIPKIYLFLKKNRTDIVISAVKNLSTTVGIITAVLPKIKVVAREVNIDSVLKNYPESNNRSYPQVLNRIGDCFNDVVVCQSIDMLNEMIQTRPNLRKKLILINNPITFTPPKNLPKVFKQIEKPYKFITIGSLVPRKGHLRILEVLKDFPEPFVYTIIGSGSELNKIKSFIQKNQLNEKVIHIPFSSDVQYYLSINDIFLLGSYVEGFPNVLLEACAYGLPILAYNAPGGINEIIQPGENGYVASNPEDFLKTLSLIINQKWSKKKIQDSVYNRYQSEMILGQYEQLFLNLVSNPPQKKNKKVS